MQPAAATSADVARPRVLVIGAGFGGVAAAALLLRAGFDDVTVLEKGDRVGGVWRQNRYPGCACDIPAPLYSYSFAQKPDWSSRFPGHEEIRQYLQDCVEAFGLAPRLRLRHELVSARWDATTASWHAQVRGPDGAVTSVQADVLVPAVGQLSVPHLPHLPGVETFSGQIVHTATWPDDLDVRGRRVGVIGTGASAIQLVPAIAGTASHVTVFQRTPPWTLPKPGHRYNRLSAAVYRRVPSLMALPRLGFWAITVLTGLAVTGNRAANAIALAISNGQRRLQVRDRQLRAALTPDYPMGCKRVLFTSTWFPTLQRPDVDLVTSPVAQVVPDGVVTADGRHHPLDVLVHGTGFEAGRSLVPLDITGPGGLTLDQAWAQGARAYLGMTVPDLPNLLVMYGPNTNTGNTSVIYFLEAQARYLVQLVRLLAARRRDDRLATVAVRQEVEERYDREIQSRLADSVWVQCTNWYRDGDGRVVANWPGLASEYHRRTRDLDPADFLPR